MTSSLRLLIVLAAVLTIGGCRQPDGPIPMPEGEDLNRIEDLANNLQNIARGDPDGEAELADDLVALASSDEYARTAALELAHRMAAALPGPSLEKEISVELGRQLWLAMAAREIGERQVQELQAELRATLTSIGVEESDADMVVAQVADVQSALTERPRRWYQLF